MPQVGAQLLEVSRGCAKSPGLEPLPGYTLIEPLGRGGFGEVWKCEAPGGLHKAVKFVAGADDDDPGSRERLRQEYEAFKQVRLIRHPFLLSLERVELVADELVMVMELADRQLADRFTECRAQGLPGIPRDEMIGYLREAAEALDYLGSQYGLQHLDVKPANLFLIAGHLKVGDYGLVSRLEGARGKNRGLTPRYSAPEVLCGEVHTRSDQYSLALVYCELTTGTFPYVGKSAQEMMVRHMSATPDLRGLPPSDRPPVAQALSKAPDGRFGSCLEFVRALVSTTPGPVSGSQHGTRALRRPAERPLSGVPTVQRRVAPDRMPQPLPVAPVSPDLADAAQDVFSVPQVKLEQIFALVPVPWLLGREAVRSPLSAEEATRAIVSAGELMNAPALGTIIQPDETTWSCRFLTALDPRMARVKLDLMWEDIRLWPEDRPTELVARRLAPVPPPSGLFGFGKKTKPPESGYEIVIHLPELGRKTGEVDITARLFGNPPVPFVQSAEREIVKLIERARRELNAVPERRVHPRVPATFPVTLYPMRSDGSVELPVPGVCEDVSAGGVAFVTELAPKTKYLFVEFDGVPTVQGQALLAQIVRTEPRENGTRVCARYRLDVGAGGVGA